jgi:hypothetical protein
MAERVDLGVRDCWPERCLPEPRAARGVRAGEESSSLASSKGNRVLSALQLSDIAVVKRARMFSFMVSSCPFFLVITS